MQQRTAFCDGALYGQWLEERARTRLLQVRDAHGDPTAERHAILETVELSKHLLSANPDSVGLASTLAFGLTWLSPRLSFDDKMTFIAAGEHADERSGSEWAAAAVAGGSVGLRIRP